MWFTLDLQWHFNASIFLLSNRNTKNYDNDDDDDDDDDGNNIWLNGWISLRGVLD